MKQPNVLPQPQPPESQAPTKPGSSESPKAAENRRVGGCWLQGAGSAFSRSALCPVLPHEPYRFRGSWLVLPKGNRNSCGLSRIKSTADIKKLKPAKVTVQINQTGSLAVRDRQPSEMPAKSVAHALTFTLADRVPFHPPPQTICEIALMRLPNVKDHPRSWLARDVRSTARDAHDRCAVASGSALDFSCLGFQSRCLLTKFNRRKCICCSLLLSRDDNPIAE